MGKRKSSLGKTPGLDFLTVIALIAAAIVSLFPGSVGAVHCTENGQCSDNVSTGDHTKRNYME